MQEMQETQVWSLGQEDPPEEEMEIHSSILAWKIPWTQEPNRLQSMESQRVGRDWAHTHSGLYALFIFSGNFQSAKITLDKSRKMVGAGGGAKVNQMGKSILKKLKCPHE